MSENQVWMFNDVWTLLPDEESAFHCRPSGFCIKYVSNQGRELVLYSRNEKGPYEVETHPSFIGTYNYGKYTHIILDILPWIIAGNSSEDTSSVSQRMCLFIKSIPGWLRSKLDQSEWSQLRLSGRVHLHLPGRPQLHLPEQPKWWIDIHSNGAIHMRYGPCF